MPPKPHHRDTEGHGKHRELQQVTTEKAVYERKEDAYYNGRPNQHTTNWNRVAGRRAHLNWSSIPSERPGDGIERQMVFGDRIMICRFRFAPYLVTPEHSHPHEQMSHRCSGRVRFVIEGENALPHPATYCTFPQTVATAPP